MKNKEKYAIKKFEEYLEILGLLNIDLTYSVNEDIESEVYGSGHLASINYDYPYQYIHLRIARGLLKESKEKINKVMLNEALHILHTPLCYLARSRYTSKAELSNAEENYIDQLTMVMYRLLEKDK